MQQTIVEIKKQSFKEQMLSLVHNHGAVNNDFLTRFAIGEITREEFTTFAIEFYHFSRNFPLVLCSLLINTKDETEAAEITKILVSELGDGKPHQRHELLYRNFLRSIDIDPIELIGTQMQNTTKAWIDTQIELYSHPNHFLGLGASFGLENMAIIMWNQLIAGLRIAKKRWFKNMNIGYFTFHRKLEEQHEDAMEAALEIHESNEEAKESIQNGAIQVLEAEEAFWVGLS